MKRAFVLILAAVLAVGMFAIAGCGDTSKAQEYMKQGDKLSAEITLFTGETLTDAGALLAKLGLDYADTGTVEAKTLTDEGKKQIDKLVEAAAAAEAEYKKILELDGVVQYEEYANLRIKMLDSTVEVLDSLSGLLDELAEAPEGTPVKQVLTDWAKANATVLITVVAAYTAAKDAENVKKQIAAEEK